MPWVMMVLSSATTGLPRGERLGDRAHGCRRRGGRFLASWDVSDLSALHAVSSACGTRREHLRQIPPATDRGTDLSLSTASTAAATPSRSASRSGRPRSMATVVAPASASPAPVTSTTLRGGGRRRCENSSSPSKPTTALSPAVMTPRAEAELRAAHDRSRDVGVGRFRPARATSRRFRNRQARPGSRPFSRTTLAGEMAMAKTGLPRRAPHRPRQRLGRQVGVAEDGVGAGERLAHLAAAHLLGRRPARRAPCRQAR